MSTESIITVRDESERDPFTAEHWNGLVRVIVHPANRRRVPSLCVERGRALFGGHYSDQVWAELVGAPDGAQVDVTAWDVSDSVRLRDAVHVDLSHPWLDGQAIRFAFRDREGGVCLLNEFMKKREGAPQLTGARIFANQVGTARRLGVAFIAANAAGRLGGSMNGYYTWARLGFDGPISAAVRYRLPAELVGAHTVLDVMERGGAEVWRQRGEGFEGTFDLHSGSRSMRVFRDYTLEKGIRI